MLYHVSFFFFAVKPQVDTPPQNQTVNENGKVDFSCVAAGNPAVASYKWFNPNNVEITSGGKFTISTQSGKSNLQISNVQKDDVGFYKCAGINDLGEGKKASAYLKVNCKYLIFLN